MSTKPVQRAHAAGLSQLAPLVLLVLPISVQAVESLRRYYAHAVHEDEHGVIAPWHKGQNGPFDERLRIAVELYKRYPWVTTDKAVMAAPHIVYNTHWRISDEGKITIPPTHPWMCGDLSQRALSIIQGLTKHYAYSGDPLAFVYIPLTVDYVLDYCLTGPDHPWPRFPIATPTRGIGYRRANPDVANQLDLCAYLGLEVLRAYKFTGTPRYLDAAKHWGDVIARKCNLTNPDLPPWSRYVSPEHMLWSDELTGGVVLIVEFLDALIDAGHVGPDGILVRAREAGRRYVLGNLLPRWTENEVWGRHYWDMEGDLLCGVLPWICEYFMAYPEVYPNWRNDVRNVLSLTFNRNGVDPGSRGEAYSGAWAFPESSICCGTSLSYNQYTYAPAFMQHGKLADSEWSREIGRRMLLMATYDSRENGVVLDGLDGTVVAGGEWLNLAHPWPLCQIMKAIEIAPELCGPCRENHIVRSSSVITNVAYDTGRIVYEVFSTEAPTTDVLRLAFAPEKVQADGNALLPRDDLKANGYTVAPLRCGDFLVRIRHDGARRVVVEGDDPQQVMEDADLDYVGAWQTVEDARARGGSLHVATDAGAKMRCTFTGNQVRLIGGVDTDGGRADVFLDGKKQHTLIDCWNPRRHDRRLLYSRSGLPDGEHTLEIVCRGKGNPLSKGTRVYVDAVQVSAATGEPNLRHGGGPRGVQRMIFGYTEREDYVDSEGNAWRPGNEFVIRLGYGADSVVKSLYTQRRSIHIAGTKDPELYRYGLHGNEFRINLTVGPGRYYAKLMFADTNVGSVLRAWINGREAIEELNVAEAAGGKFRAFELTFPNLEPKHGMIEIRCEGAKGKEACIQAVEIGPSTGKAVRRLYRAAKPLLINATFEADLKRVPKDFSYTSDAPLRWQFVKTDTDDHGIQNIVPYGRGKVGAWIGTGDGVFQVARHHAVSPVDVYRIYARARGKGKEGVAGSTSVGNRVGVTLCWTRNPEDPFAGRNGEDWDVLAESSLTVEANDVWQDLRAECLARDRHAGPHLVVKGWYEHERGTPDSYVHFDEISLVRAGGMVTVE